MMLHGTIAGQSRLGAVRLTETGYNDGVFLAHHCHADPYISILIEGNYTEVRAGAPRHCATGTVIVHHPGEVHADYFLRFGRCLNVEILDRSHAAHAALSRDGTADANRRLESAAWKLASVYAAHGRPGDTLKSLVDELLEAKQVAFDRLEQLVRLVPEVLDELGAVEEVVSRHRSDRTLPDYSTPKTESSGWSEPVSGMRMN